MRKSKILAKLRQNKPVLVSNVSMSPSPLIVEMAGRAGLDGVWIDMEHRPFSQREVAEMIAGARISDVDVVVRIRSGEGYTSIFRPLEDGAAGIVVPHVKNAEEAKWVTQHAKFPPLGNRGVECMMPDADLGFIDPKDYMEHANKETLVILQIEDAEALDELDAIAAVPGFEILFIGPADLSCSLGIPFQFDHPKYLDAVERIVNVANKNGKWWGMPLPDMDSAVKHLGAGIRFCWIQSDYSLLFNGFRATRRDFDRMIDLSKG